MAKELIVKDNALINASYSLSLSEQRLILLAIIEARQSKLNITSDIEFTVHSDSYMNQFEVTRQTAYVTMKDACQSLLKRQFSYQKLTSKGNIEVVSRNWVQGISYVNSEALVRVQFTSDVVSLISNLEKHFTSYELEQVSDLNSSYAVRLYEVLIAWRSTGIVPMMELDEFRLKLGVLDGQYKAMSDFKRYVLDLAISQINEHTDIKVEYEQHKRGRTIIGFSFTFKQKKTATTKAKPKPLPLTKGYIEKHALPGESYEQAFERLKEKQHSEQNA